MSRIEAVSLHRLEVPLRVPYKLAFGIVRHFDTLIAEVRDSDGFIGLGEATVLTGYTEETVEGSWTLMQQLAAGLPGMRGDDAIEALLEHVDNAPFTVTALATAIEMLGNSELMTVGKPASAPLLGIVNAESGQALAKEADSLFAQGFDTFKVKVGFDVEKDLAKLGEVQRIVAGRAAIRVDGNQGYSRDEALRFVSRMSPEAIELLEQPCAAGDWESAVAVARIAPVPMMLDESIYGIADIERAAELKAARFIKLKLMKMGTMQRLASGLALIRSLGMEPVLGNGVACEVGCWMEGLAARAGITNAGEMNGFLKPVAPLLASPLKFSDGAIVLEPGFRPKLDESAVRRFSVGGAEFVGQGQLQKRPQ